MDLYAETILDHYKHPRLQGRLDQPSVTRSEKNLSCGDSLTLDLQIEDTVIQKLAWIGGGCAISQAGMSLLAEVLVGKTVGEASMLSDKDIRELLGVDIGTRRAKCALLCLHTLKNAIHTYRGEAAEGWNETIGNTAETR